ncbi:MAG TPA: DUF3459 domain-containing protein, partial [Rhodanobacteraceae bacterium]|nr:DUF3459 domain-containing protein [Rhodanobacteraceae bacterium]
LLAPSIPLLFMGEEWGSKQPFLFFCDYEGELAEAVREGRRKEFGKFAAFADPSARERIPDPNAETTFAASTLDWPETDSGAAGQRLALVRQLLELREREIVPRLDERLHGGHYELTDGRAFRIEWGLADGTLLHLVANLGKESVRGLDWKLPGRRLFASPDFPDAPVTELPPWSIAWSCE